MLTVRGVKQTYLSLLPHLIKVWKREGFFRSMVVGCSCQSGDCNIVPPNPLPGGEWSGCPFAVLRQPWATSLFSLYAMKEISPLHGWPNDYPAWMASGLVQIDRAMEG